jgi:hypothetical protein
VIAFPDLVLDARAAGELPLLVAGKSFAGCGAGPKTSTGFA